MTIGWWVMFFGVLLCFFEAPVQAVAIVGVGILPFIIAMFKKWWAWLLGLPLYGLALFATGYYITLAETGMPLVLFPVLAIVALVSWGVLIDNM